MADGMDYVVGFAFYKNKVLLVKKDRPEWQAGFLNGPGGKIEFEETPLQAMSREFYEEVGISVAWSAWRYYCHLVVEAASIYFYTIELRSDSFIQMESEEPVWIDSDNLPDNIINNLSWLIPMAKAKYNVVASIFEHTHTIRGNYG